jgi:hypothetical protein
MTILIRFAFIIIRWVCKGRDDIFRMVGYADAPVRYILCKEKEKPWQRIKYSIPVPEVDQS